MLFSAGNKGEVTGQCLTNEAHSKNAIIVGALNGSYDVWSKSSRGLTADGRVSPTVMAPGVCITSAKASNATNQSAGCAAGGGVYIDFSGTSMATPAVAGSVALIRQYLREGWYPTGVEVTGHEVTPSGALLKALLVNSALQLTGVGTFQNFNYFPNGDQGWGRPLLDDVLYFGLEGETRKTGWRYVSPGLDTGETMIFKVSVTSNTGPMNVALVWMDYEAAVGCTDCLLNDLDLILKSPGGDWYHGNLCECGYAFPPGPPYESCEHTSQTLLSLDRKNTVETFYAITPPTGEWEVRVSGASVPMGTQRFALVLTGHGLTQNIGGIVQKISIGTPLANAKVTLTGVQNSYTTFTGSDGRFLVAALPDVYTMTTERCDYLTDTRTVTSDPGFLREEVVVLTPRMTGTVWGKVTDIYGTPLSGAWVRETCTGNQDFTDSNGMYSIQVPAGVDVQVKASKVGYYLSTKTVNVAPGGSKELNFALTEIPCTINCPA